ncbi:MAG: phosphoribosyltransferase [Candidatus Heimdallarchaeaceae archaeon]
MQYEIVSWDEAYNMCYYLFEKLINANEFPDIIVGIARGGWIPARLLSDFYGNKFTANIKIEFYRDTSQVRENPIITQELTAEVKSKKILIVDDVADSGKSLQAAMEHIKTKDPKSIKTATLHYKKHSVVVPDFYINLTDKWIVYPWEYGEFIAFQYKELRKKHTVLEIKKQLKDIGIPPHLVESYFEKVLTNN